MPLAQSTIFSPGVTHARADVQPEAPRAETAERGSGRLRVTVSLRTELLLNLAVLATAALLLAITTIVLFDAVLATPSGLLLLTVMVTADIVVFVTFGYRLTGRLVLEPLAAVVESADRIAAGERGQRVPDRGAPEFVKLARAINAMTDQLIAEQQRVVRVEKMASLGRLAAGVAHEVGNPLGAINGYTHLLKRKLGGHDEALAMVGDLEREVSRVDRIMRGLLDYARPRRTPAARCDVSDSVRRVTALLGEQRVLSHVRLDLAVGSALPPVHADPHALDQVLVNLLINAGQATPVAGRVCISAREASLDEALGRGALRATDRGAVPMPRSAALRLGAWQDGTKPDRFIELIVADSGPGIPDADLERVFDPFFTTKSPGEGTGLGLAIVARTIEDAGGIVFARRAREGGAAFVVLLPAAAVPDEGTTRATNRRRAV